MPRKHPTRLRMPPVVIQTTRELLPILKLPVMRLLVRLVMLRKLLTQQMQRVMLPRVVTLPVPRVIVILLLGQRVMLRNTLLMLRVLPRMLRTKRLLTTRHLAGSTRIIVLLHTLVMLIDQLVRQLPMLTLPTD
ncbi:hypothetical protein [Lentilactobacillus parafarraginis]|uniref:hypothetical protein n=1 Tax=Lentilactobacillus parafarraginis TaxID=390842 RepID=UPI0006CF8470|nr:hypothetical protein [Lentilactobacillus parafarraginis]